MPSDKHVTPENLDLFDLVKHASEGRLALPQFQRKFVWSPEDVRELLVSVFNGYFIGALLLLEIDRRKPPFSIRAVEGCDIDENALLGLTTQVLLDGQQRITSLYYAFYEPDIPLKGYKKNSTVFFVDLDKFFAGDIDSAVTSKPRNKCLPDELNRGNWQYDNRKIPLRELLHLVRLEWSLFYLASATER